VIYRGDKSDVFGAMHWASLLPLGASSFTVAVVCYPVDVLRALKMSGAGGSGVTAGEFYAQYGLRGFFGQGMGPEVTRATVMRVSKFFFNPVVSNVRTYIVHSVSRILRSWAQKKFGNLWFMFWFCCGRTRVVVHAVQPFVSFEVHSILLLPPTTLLVSLYSHNLNLSS
jgi:hypothetical protein